MASVAGQAVSRLRKAYPWTSLPLIVGAPMRVISGPTLAVAISNAGGLGFIGPGVKPTDLESALSQTSSLVSQSSGLSKLTKGQSSGTLPIGVGFQTWAGDLPTASRILRTHCPAAVWLFAPRQGQAELDEWSRDLRAASPDTQIWIQVASVADALAAARSSERPDVLVVQGTDAGGHSMTKGAGIMTLLPEVFDALNACSSTGDRIPLVAAGGIIDSRGVAASLALGASAIAMGTRFLASSEATINPGYQRHVIEASDGGQNTVRTQLYNHLRGTTNWPEPFDARGLVNQTWRDHEAGVSFERNKELYTQAMKLGEGGWGHEGRMATYAGTGVGLVTGVKPAGEIVKEVRDGIGELLEMAQRNITL